MRYPLFTAFIHNPRNRRRRSDYYCDIRRFRKRGNRRIYGHAINLAFLRADAVQLSCISTLYVVKKNDPSKVHPRNRYTNNRNAFRIKKFFHSAFPFCIIIIHYIIYFSYMYLQSSKRLIYIIKCDNNYTTPDRIMKKPAPTRLLQCVTKCCLTLSMHPGVFREGNPLRRCTPVQATVSFFA